MGKTRAPRHGPVDTNTAGGIIAINVRKLAAARGTNALRMSRESGFTYSTVHAWFAGRAPITARGIWFVCHFLQCTPGQLFEGVTLAMVDVEHGRSRTQNPRGKRKRG